MARKITLSPRRPVNASRRGFVVLLGAVPLAGLLPGCGGSGDGRLRLANASIAYPNVDIEINDDVERTGVAAQSVDGFFNVEIDEDSHTLGIRSGSTTLAETSLGIDIDERWSAIFFGAESSFGLIAYQEDEDQPDDDEFRLRAFNASATETIDVYVTDADALLSAVAPAVSGAAQETLTAFDDIASGTWRLRLTTGGNRTEVRLDTTVTLGGERVGTLVIYPSTSGLLVNAVLLVEERDAISLVNPKARLRFVNALASSTSITPTLDGTASGSTLPARTAASYVEADTGDRTVGALVNGSSFTTTVTLAGAIDATCAIYGADSAPKVIVIADDNRAPTVSGQARIRLVNLVDGGGSLSLSIDLGSAVLTTAPGETSDHLQFTAIDDAQIDVLDGSGLSVATLTAVDLLADAVYTVFAMTDGSTVSAVLRRDR
ncbi:DUF4397 domain-containing protein [Caldimonas sp. KR1-144]|uniref:DUF4397 domain-containing protein n=1 Tax=Caldimonas sp. KR1-144 TaxID=3400911 RepID=UPI003BFD30DE